MKKILLPVLVFVSCLNNTYAQRYQYDGGGGGPRGPRGREMAYLDASDFRFGVFLAPNVSWMKPTANKSDDKLYLVNSEGSKVGFTWGLMIDYQFADNYGINTGFQLNTTGGKINASLNPNATTTPTSKNVVQSAYFDYRLQYLELPFNLKLISDPLPAGDMKVFGQIGLAVDFNISKKATYSVSYTDEDKNGNDIVRTVNETNEKIQGMGITPVMFQLNLGGGIEYPITEKMSFYSAIIFSNGFAPDVTNPKDFNLGYLGKFTDANTRLNNISLRIGLFF